MGLMQHMEDIVLEARMAGGSLPDTLVCHPLVIVALRYSADVEKTWDRPSLVSVRVQADTSMPTGHWELRKGDEVIAEGNIHEQPGD